MKRRHKKKIPLVSYLFILPALILNLMFFVFPFLQSLLMSFYDWPVLGEKTFVFLDNYINCFRMPSFGIHCCSPLKLTRSFVDPVACLFWLLSWHFLINGAFKGVEFVPFPVLCSGGHIHDMLQYGMALDL